MTPKEKAEQIVNELFERSLAYHDAVIAANFLVDEILYVIGYTDGSTDLMGTHGYWCEVKSELEKL